jgi:hypothetical protein
LSVIDRAFLIVRGPDAGPGGGVMDVKLRPWPQLIGYEAASD